MKIKTLPPTLREPKRYMFFECIGADSNVPFEHVVEPVWEQLLSLLGEDEVARMDCWVMKNLYDAETGTGCIRVHNDFTEQLRTALALVMEIEEADGIRVLGVSGTIQAGAKKYLERNVSFYG